MVAFSNLNMMSPKFVTFLILLLLPAVCSGPVLVGACYTVCNVTYGSCLAAVGVTAGVSGDHGPRDQLSARTSRAIHPDRIEDDDRPVK